MEKMIEELTPEELDEEITKARSKLKKLIWQKNKTRLLKVYSESMTEKNQKRFEGKTKEEISEYMKKVRNGEKIT